MTTEHEGRGKSPQELLEGKFDPKAAQEAPEKNTKPVPRNTRSEEPTEDKGLSPDPETTNYDSQDPRIENEQKPA